MRGSQGRVSRERDPVFYFVRSVFAFAGMFRCVDCRFSDMAWIFRRVKDALSIRGELRRDMRRPSVP